MEKIEQYTPIDFLKVYKQKTREIANINQDIRKHEFIDWYKEKKNIQENWQTFSAEHNRVLFKRIKENHGNKEFEKIYELDQLVHRYWWICNHYITFLLSFKSLKFFELSHYQKQINLYEKALQKKEEEIKKLHLN